ncbi:uncharacterized protein LOC128238985 [Mya arenaria]|nr:uncharacterized protein LOC128238985 [Mya arenaria]
MSVVKARPIQSKTGPRKKVLPKIVQLGHQLPVKRPDELDVWTPVDVSGEIMSSECSHSYRASDGADKHRCPKFKNLFEYNIQHGDKYQIGRRLWKIPSIGNNFMPFHDKHSKSSEKDEIAMYRPKFQRWYNRLVHENTVILPPIETSERVKDNVFESNNFNEKKYVLKRNKNTGPRERFVRDEMYLPDAYSTCFTCKECHKQYASDAYVQTWAKRNQLSPTCTTTTTSSINGASTYRRNGRSIENRGQHCDVLGERYCQACVEWRNKMFSLQVEDKLANSNDLKKVHYSTRF